jgi:hypothetical protein
MTRFRALPALALAAGLLFAAGVTSAQPPNLFQVPKQPPKVVVVPREPLANQPKVVPVQGGELPVIPKSAGAFISLKVSDVMDHADLKPVMEQLKKTPEAFEGVIELFGVMPHEIDRVTLFWPTVSQHGPGDPVVVITTREAYNEARVLKILRAEPVYDGDSGRGFEPAFGSGMKSVPARPATGFPEPKGSPAPFPPKGEIEKGPAKSPEPPEEKKQAPADDDTDTVFISTGTPGDALFYGLRNGPFELLFMVDDHTLVFLPSGHRNEFAVVALLAQLMQKKQTGPLSDAIAEAGNHTFASGIYLPPLFRELERRLPPELAPYAALTAAKVGTITGDLGKTAKFTLKLTFDDATAAKRAAPVLEEGLKSVAEKIGEHIADAKESRRPREKALVPLMEAAAKGLKGATVKAEGSTVIATTEIDAGPASSKAVGELLQSLQSRKKFALRTNNLKQIGLALHSYFDANGKLPANVYNAKGEAILSWRVHLLPYLEQQNLYQQFKMDEPWDGPNNKKLIEKMPKVFDTAGREAPKGETFYQAFLTPDFNRPLPKGANPPGRTWLVEGDKQGQSLLVPDGTSNTIGIVEARNSVIWSKPDDLPFGEKLPPLGEAGADVFMALMLDGSVRAISTKIKQDTLRLLIDGYDGQVIPDVFEDEPRGGGFPLRNRPVDEARIAEARVAEDNARLLENAARQLEQIRLLEEQLAESRAALNKAKAVAEVQAAQLERVSKAFAVGAAAKKEVDEAKALLDQARTKVDAGEQEVKKLEEQLAVAKHGFDKGGIAPARPVEKK